MDIEQRVGALAAVPIFRQVARRDLRALAESATEREFSAGTAIVTEGELGIAMFVITSGEAVATKQDVTEPIATFKTGDFFGEMALFEHFPRSATVTARTDVRALAITEWDFQAELATAPSFQQQVLKAIVRRLRDTTTELARARGRALVD